MLKGRCGAASPHRLEAALVLCQSRWQPAARCKHRLVLKGRGGLPARTAWKQLWCSKAAAGCQPAPLASNFGAQRPLPGCQPAPLEGIFGVQRPLEAASPHWEAALVLKGRCGLPARLKTDLVFLRRCGLLARTAWQQLWCSKLAAGCQPARLENNFGVLTPLRAASPHRLQLW